MFAPISMCFIKSVQHRYRAFFGPEAGRAFIIVAALHCFQLGNGTFLLVP